MKNTKEQKLEAVWAKLNIELHQRLKVAVALSKHRFQQDWVAEAIAEKLEREEGKDDLRSNH